MIVVVAAIMHSVRASDLHTKHPRGHLLVVNFDKRPIKLFTRRRPTLRAPRLILGANIAPTPIAKQCFPGEGWGKRGVMLDALGSPN